MKFGLFFLPSFDAATHKDAQTLYQQIFEQVELCEELGCDCTWCAEHHFTPYGGDIPSPPLFLAALAQRTRRMRLGTSGVALPINRPLNTAEQLAMVDNMCGGRLDIGMVNMVEALMDFDVMYDRRSAFGDPAHASEGIMPASTRCRLSPSCRA